jgi:hypothetical protein
LGLAEDSATFLVEDCAMSIACRWVAGIAGLCVSAFVHESAQAQATIFVDCAGVNISSLSTNPADVVRTGTTTIDANGGYTFNFNPIVSGTGILGGLIGTNVRLGDVLNSFVAGQHRILYGAVRNPGAGIPVNLDIEVVGGSFSGINVALTLDYKIRADRKAEVAIRNIQKPFGLGLRVESGGLNVQTWTPPAARFSEWHFDGSLASVQQSGLAPSSGPARIRYLDDAAFGPILGGIGNENNYPSPPTPTGITQAQSTFNTTAAFGLPPIGGSEDTVYRTSPPRNLADPTNSDKARGIGLALWPNSRDYWPEDRNGQWTMIWDILIPTAAWNTEYPAPLIQDNHNNDGDADAFLRKNGAALTFGYQVPTNSFTTLPGVAPNQWFRLAISSDGYRSKQGRVFVNGTYVGTTGGDWVYASCKSTDPRWGDDSSTNLDGTPVATATWAQWLQFPSPWAKSPNTAAAPMAATICLFADLLGRGESIYVANFAYADEAMSDAQIAALGGPSWRGIVHLKSVACPADFNADTVVDFFDYLDFVAAFSSNDPAADFNADAVIDFFDYLDFVASFSSGC